MYWRLLITICAFVAATGAVPPPDVAWAGFERIQFGLDPDGARYPCPFRVETSRWAATDHFTGVVVQWGPTRQRDRRDIDVVYPNGRSFRNTATWDTEARARYSAVAIPLLGTPAETWLGTWRVVVFLNGAMVGEGAVDVLGPRVGALAEYQRALAASPNSAWAHFRVGATASIGGQFDIAERHLREAARLQPIARTPRLAMALTHLRAGDKDKARTELIFLRGLLMGQRDDPGTYNAFYRAMLEDLLKEVGE